MEPALPPTRRRTEDPREREACRQRLTVFPNPFDATTTIEYNLNREQEVGLVLYNTLGQVVQVLQTPQLKAEGSNKLTLQAADLAGGIYYVVMTSEQGKMTYKVILNK